MKKVVKICMGSSCYLKGTEKVVKVFMKKIEELGLENDVELKGSFCLGPCIEAVVVEIDGKLVKNVRPENAEKVFDTMILPMIRER